MYWFGLNWVDIIINVVALAIVPGLLAAYGGNLAAQSISDKSRRRNVYFCFWGLFLAGTAVTFWQQFRVAQADFAKDTREIWADAEIAREFRPPPPPTIQMSTTPVPKAKMEFVFFGNEINGESVNEIRVPSIGGKASITFSIRTLGATIPTDGTLWIRICDQCTFASVPSEFLEDKDDPHFRSKGFRILYAGVILPKMTIDVSVPDGNPSRIPLAFYYACANCVTDSIKHPQFLTLDVVYPAQ
jgi:hypothetical protein